MSIPFQQIREVRRARPDEAVLLSQLVLAERTASGDPALAPFDASNDALLAWIASDIRELYVAARVTELAVGMAAVGPGDDALTAHLPLLLVAATHRRRGWGTRLARQALIWARRRGASTLRVARPADGSADRFADSLGWRLTGGSFLAEIDP